MPVNRQPCCRKDRGLPGGHICEGGVSPLARAHPRWFFSRTHQKALFVLFGLHQVVHSQRTPFHFASEKQLCGRVPPHPPFFPTLLTPCPFPLPRLGPRPSKRAELERRVALSRLGF